MKAAILTGIFTLILFFGNKVFSQVTFYSRPTSLQLYPRNILDSAIVNISGIVTSTSYNKVIITMHKNGLLKDSTVAPLMFNGGNAPFAINYPIHSEKSKYLFKFYLSNQNTVTLFLRADSVCSGDVYLIDGQSNAQAVANGPGTDPQNLWVRSFGTQSNLSSNALSDTVWGLGNGANGNSHMSIGVWAHRLGRMLADTAAVPVCIINGGQSSSRIVQHLPSINHSNLSSIYGRLLYRAQKAHVENKIKALFWYQGEIDGDTAYLQYANRFAQLHNAWEMDYPGLEKIIVIQTRPGCVISPTELYHQQIRETLRTLPDVYTNVKLMTTAGIPYFDGCHFLTQGYQLLAQRLYFMLRDEFGNFSSGIASSYPPRILKAEYVSTNDIELIFDQSVIWPVPFNGYDLKNYFYFDTTITVTSGSSSGDTLKLHVSNDKARTISYLPAVYYEGTTDVYEGPWLFNNSSVGIPPFYSFHIDKRVQGNALFSANTTTLCLGNSVVFSSNSTGNPIALLWQFPGGSPLTSVSQNPTVTYNSSGSKNVTLVATYATGIDTLTIADYITVSPSKPGVPGSISVSGGNAKVCPGNVRTYSVTSVARATKYIWTLPAGCTITAGNNSRAITVLFNNNFSTSGTLSVAANNSCGTSAKRNLTIARNIPAAPSNISGPTYGLCSVNNKQFTVTNVSGITYNWTLSPIGAFVVNGQGTAKAKIDFPASNFNGTLSVTASNSCGISTPVTLSVKTIPSTPATISGPSSVCSRSNNKTYTITAISSANSYTWTGPTGSHIKANGVTSLNNMLTTNSTSVSVDYGNTTGEIKVKANNNCGSGNSKSLMITFNCKDAMEEVISNSDFNIFPNPVNFKLNISSANSKDGDYKITLTNTLGQVMEKTEMKVINSHFNTQINVEKLPPDIYFLIINSNKSEQRFKIVKQ